MSHDAKRLILVRHAHRDKKAGRERDNGLSSTGKEQAKLVKQYYLHRFRDSVPYVVSSPKLRCVETIFDIAHEGRTEVQISDLLDEQHESPDSETDRAFKGRIHKFIDWWEGKSSPPLVVACTHGDWIPLFLKEALGAELKLDKGGIVEIVMEKGKPKISTLMQSPTSTPR